MKTDRRDEPPAIGALMPTAAAPSTATAGKPPFRRALTVLAIGMALSLALVLGRHAIAGWVVVRALALATGDNVEIGSFVLGYRRIVLNNVRITTANGEPLLAAQNVTVGYLPADLWRGGPHRFGLSEIDIVRPVFTVIRHADGSYNLAAGKVPGGGGTGSDARGAPWTFAAHVHDGVLRFVDRSPVAPDLAEQVVGNISIAAQIASDGQSRGHGRALLLARQVANARLQAWPIGFNALSDTLRGVLQFRVQAQTLPLRGPIGLIQHSGAVRVDGGLLHAFEFNVFALNVGMDQLLDAHVGGRARLTDGRLTVAALREPVRDLRGALRLTDDGVWSRRLTGTLAGVVLVARGGAFNRLRPELRLGVSADGDLRNLRSLFAFSRTQPVAGRARVQTLIEAPVSGLVVRTALRIGHATYGRLPLDDVRGHVDYHASTVVLDAVRARYGGADVGVGGRFLLGPTLDSSIAITAYGPGRSLPYAENVAPNANISVAAIISGTPAYRARAAIGLRGGDTNGSAMVSIDNRGVGEFGPFAIERSDGSSLLGALRLERPKSLSAAWISARHYRIDQPKRSVRLPGLTLPAFPPIAGRVDVALVGGGSPDGFRIAGSLRGQDLRVNSLELGTGQALLGGTLADVRLSEMVIAGPVGRFRGSAASASGTFSLRGTYDGSLDRLVPLTGRQSAHGGLHGAILASLHDGDSVVQSTGAQLHAASIRGVALESAAGTIAVRGDRFQVVSADAAIGGRRAVAREYNGSVAISAPDLPSSALRATGIPLERGNLSIYGLADLRAAAPSFDGTVALADGTSQGYRVAGDAQLDLDGAHATIFAATGALGSTFGAIGGSIDGIGQRALRYDLDTRVPLGDVALLRRDLHIPIRYLEGSFAANLHVRGAGNRPVADGTVEAPEGVYNGLAFRDASAQLALSADGVAARDGHLTVGSTQAAVSASRGVDGFALLARAEHADLADFNDYFDSGDTLAGRGRFDLRFRTSAGRMDTRGAVAFQELRYRDYPLGDSRAAWHMNGPDIVGQASVASGSGKLAAAGKIAPPAGVRDPLVAFRAAAYDVRASVDRMDLGRWLPAAGFSQPVLGKVDARLRITGERPHVGVALDATLRDASIAGYPVRSGHIRASAVGSRITVASSSAELGFATLSGSGTLGLDAADRIAFDLRANTDDVGKAMATFVPGAHGLTVAGALDADVRFSGTRDKPIVQGGFDLANARYGNFTVPRAIGALALAGRAIELRDADVEFVRGQAFVAGALPLQLQPLGVGPPGAALSFDVTARGVDLAQFAPLFPDGTKLGGTVDGRFGVEGTVDRPRLLGSLGVTNGSYLSRFERAPIQDVNARLTFEGTSIALQTLHAGVGGGTLDAGGRITLPFGAQSHTSYALMVRAGAAKLDFPAYGRGTLDGTLRLTGGLVQPLLAGDIALHDAVIPAAAVYGSGSNTAGAAGGGALPIDPKFAIRATAGNNVRVRSSIVDIGVTGGVDLSGSLRSPRLAGAFTATDGTVSSYNHVFRVVHAAASFDPADGILPTIEARATTRVTDPDPDPSRNIAGSANITVNVSGTPDSNNLQVAYSSDPPYSQEQIVGLLFDVPALLGAVNFNLNGGTGASLLRGAPGETNALLPPGVSPEQVSAISFNQEVFSLLNGQFTQRALNPIERVFEKVFGLSDLEFTVDYGGGLGYSLRRQIGQHNFSAFLSQTVTYPERSNFGFELEPKPFEIVNFSYYQQNGVTSLITNQTPGALFAVGSTRRLTSVQPLGNRSGFSLNFSRRF